MREVFVQLVVMPTWISPSCNTVKTSSPLLILVILSKLRCIAPSCNTVRASCAFLLLIILSKTPSISNGESRSLRVHTSSLIPM